MAGTSEELEWVIDAALFKKFCSDRGSEISINDLWTGLNDDDKNELDCLIEFLDAIRLGKSVACHDDKIHQIYSDLVLKLPNELCEMLFTVISIEASFRKVDEDFEYKNKKPFIGTDLEDKIPYIAVAYFLSHKIIVSTCNNVEVEGCYHENRDKLFLLKIKYEDVCKACKEIKQYAD